MSFLAILCALLLEQIRPLSRNNFVHRMAYAWCAGVRRNVDAGLRHHGWLAWCAVVVLPAVLAVLMDWALRSWVGWPLAVLWNIAVLYCTLGFRQFSHHFTRIRDALQDGDEMRARELLARWQRVDASELPRSEVVRHVIEYSVLAAHRHVFGVLAWFCLLSVVGLGTAGPVLYRMGELAQREWQRRDASGLSRASAAVQTAAQQAWWVMDWLPARLTALCFAMVGNFEDAIEGWRYYAPRFPNSNDGVILAATAGAINVRLGGETLKPTPSVHEAVDISTDVEPSPRAAPQTPNFVMPDMPDATHPAGETHSETQPLSTPGRAPEVAHLTQVVGLVWRTVVVWMFLLCLLSLARLLG